MELLTLLFAILVKLVVILVTIPVILVLVLLILIVSNVYSQDISTKTNVLKLVHPDIIMLIPQIQSVLPVTLLVKNVTELPMLTVLIAQMVPTYITELVSPIVQKICSRTISLPQKPVTIVTLLVVVALVMLISVNVVLKVCSYITILVSLHVQMVIMLILPPKLVNNVITHV